MSDVARMAAEALREADAKAADVDEVVVLRQVLAHLNRKRICAKSALAIVAIEDAIDLLRERDAAKAAGGA